MARILVVEDDNLVREMLRTYLTMSGHEVITAADGVEALLQVRAAQPQLILMDMGLPRLNGWQATLRLRSRQETARIPIIAVTAYALDEDRHRALSVGCDAFASKPIDFPNLLETIDRLLLRAPPEA